MVLTPATIFAFAALAALAVGALLYALLYKSIASDKKSAQRMNSMKVDKKTKENAKSKKLDDKQRRKQREEALKNVDSQKAAGKKAESPNMATRLVQAGMTMSLRKFIVVSIIAGVVFFFVGLILTQNLFLAIGIGFVGGFGVPRWFVNMKRKRRFRAFIAIFPNAVDIIVRGIRSGLPLNDCLRIIANDADEPVKTEFRKLIEATQMGITVPEACERLYKSVPTSETNFFAIVIAIQSSAGGNLSEALANLSKVLRERRKMADKIKAVSTEAKASAGIIGSLPFIVAALVYLSTPGYLDPLFTQSAGHKILLFCALSLTFGVLIMKKMINFKF